MNQMQAQKQFFLGVSKSPTLYPKRNRKATWDLFPAVLLSTDIAIIIMTSIAFIQYIYLLFQRILKLQIYLRI